MCKYDSEVPSDWKLATVHDVRSHFEDVKKVLCGKTWYICSLQDGNVHGPGYGCKVYDGPHEQLGHKLLIYKQNGRNETVIKLNLYSFN